MSTPEHADATPPNDVPGPQTAPNLGSPVTGRTWAFVLASALIAGLGSWLAVEGLLQAYQSRFIPLSKPYPSAEDSIRIAKAQIECGTLAFGVTGGLLGLWLGLAGGVSRGSSKAAALAGGLGLLVGGLAEAGVSRLALDVIYKQIDMQSGDMLQTLLCHEALWVPIGLVGGLALGLGLGGRGRWWRAAIGGLIGASLATVAYEFLGALAFPTHGTHQPLADSMGTRALAQILICLGAAVVAILTARNPVAKSR